MSLQPQLPFVKSSGTGFKEIEDINRSVIQDFKSLLLTYPLERIGEPSFGVGLQRFLFEFPDENTKDNIQTIINEQTSKYLPFIRITNISFQSEDLNLLVTINFFIGSNSEEVKIDLPFKLGLEDNLNAVE